MEWDVSYTPVVPCVETFRIIIYLVLRGVEGCGPPDVANVGYVTTVDGYHFNMLMNLEISLQQSHAFS